MNDKIKIDIAGRANLELISYKVYCKTLALHKKGDPQTRDWLCIRRVTPETAHYDTTVFREIETNIGLHKKGDPPNGQHKGFLRDFVRLLGIQP